ncbi:MAG: hypothetical protein PHP06_05855 [Clostridia bacterium]|nr:hypothetical protein [Clostridia bacterium]
MMRIGIYKLIYMLYMFLILFSSEASAIIPYAPSNLSNVSGNFWVNYTWERDINVSISDMVKYANYSEVSTSLGPMKALSVVLNESVANIRVNYEFKAAIFYATAQTRKNGVVIGPVHGDSSTNWIPVVEEYNSSYIFVPGDTIEVWIAQGGGNGVYAKNLTVSFDYITDSYNVSVNGSWINGSTNTFNNGTVAPHGWRNISVYAYNSSGMGNLSQIPASMNTKLPNNVPIFNNFSISESQIYQYTGSSIISANITDMDGDNINASVGLTLSGIEFEYAMTKAANTTTWSYSFSSGVADSWIITNFYATDYGGRTNSTTWNQIISVVPAMPGGYSGGSGGAPSGTTAPTPTDGTNLSVTTPTLNLQTMAQDSAGKNILIIGFFVGVIMSVLGAIYKKVSKSSMYWGLLIVIITSYGLGWIQ